MTQEDLASVLSRKKSIIGSYESGTAEPDINGLTTIANFFGISISDLIGKDLSKDDNVQYGIGSDETLTTVNDVVVHYQSAQNKVFLIDESVRGGLKTSFSQKNIRNLDPITIPWLGSGTFYVFNVRGDSMSPILCNGDKVFAKQIANEDYLKSGELYVFLLDDSVLVRRYSHIERDTMILLSDNEEAYPPSSLDTKRIMGIFEIVERNTSNLSNNTYEKRQLKLYKALIELHGIKI